MNFLKNTNRNIKRCYIVNIQKWKCGRSTLTNVRSREVTPRIPYFGNTQTFYISICILLLE